MNELEALLCLTSIPGIGSIRARLLIQFYGSAIKTLEAPLIEIEGFPGFGRKILSGWEKTIEEKKWEQDILLADRLNAKIIPFNHPSYPKQLLNTVDFPLVLYVQGNLLKEDQLSLAVVGTRQPTLYGKEMAKRFSQGLAQSGYTIVSGLARGIDTAAHEGAIEGGRTIAVLGSGLASLYPPENALLAEAIKKNGALISEFPMATSPDKHHFPQRNRIVSGMTRGTFVIEAPLQSGAMLTAERAISQDKPVFALPGRVDSPCFKGNHALIKEGKAKLVEEIEDILRHYNHFSIPFSVQSSPQPLIRLEKEEEFLFNQLPSYELTIEELVSQLQWPITKLNVLLMSLVLKKKVKEYPGKIYKKI